MKPSEMKCPRCPSELSGLVSRGVHLDRCPRCDGIWFDRDELGKFNRFDSDFPLHPDNAVSQTFTTARCPRCDSFLSRTPYSPAGDFEVERCINCRGVWLDGGMIDKLRNLLANKLIRRRKMRGLDETMRREREMWQAHEAGVAQQEREKDRPSTFEWLFLFLTRLPVEVHNPVRNFPWATIGLIVANVVFWLLQNSVPSAAVLPFELVPADFLRFTDPYSVITAMFLHGGVIHLVGNMYFLYTFGDNVEDFLRPAWFLTIYFICGFVGNLAHVAANFQSTLPTIGASGAISGIFAAYILLYPRRRIYFLIIIWPMQIRAVWYGLGWIGVQILSAFVTRTGGVAWWGHIGGFLTGIVLAEAYLRFRGIRHAIAQAF